MQGSAGCLAADRPLSFLSSGAQTETPAIERMRQLSRVGAALVGDVGHGRARALVPLEGSIFLGGLLCSLL